MFHNVTWRILALAACGWLAACDAGAQAEPLAPGPERGPVLRLSTQLRSAPTADPQRRAEAAAAWQALQDANRLRSVERELQSLRSEVQQSTAALARMRAEIESDRGQRGIAAWLVASVSGVLLALFAWVGWRWYGDQRLQRVGRWFDEHGEAHRSAGARGAAQGLQTQPAPLPRAGAPAGGKESARASGGSAGPLPAMGLVLPASSPAARAATQPRPAPRPSREDPPASRGAATGEVGEVGVQEVIDLHDKADFFRSIGEHGQAIALLEAHVHDRAGTSALPWLELLELYHARDRRADYARVRGEFRQRFTAGVPEFEQFDPRAGSLDNAGGALSHIVALWPSLRVLDVIEDAILRRPGLSDAEALSLQSYRELVLLYRLARDLSEQAQVATTQPILAEHAEPVPEPVHVPVPVPVLAPAPRPDATTDRERLMVPPASVRLGVDIDLGELQALPPGGREGPALDFDLDEPDTLAPVEPARKEA